MLKIARARRSAAASATSLVVASVMVVSVSIAPIGLAKAAPLGDYARGDMCNHRGEPADVTLTPSTLTFDGKSCSIMGAWRVLHAETGTMAARVSGCGQEGYTFFWATLKTTPLSTGRTLFSIDRPRTIFVAQLCRHIPPVPRAKP